MRRVVWLAVIAACAKDRTPPQKWALAVLSQTDAPCAATDPSCDVYWTAQWFGTIDKVVHANANDYSDPARTKPSTFTTRELSSSEVAELTSLVVGDEFREGMAHGFACQGASHDPHVTWHFVFASPTGKTEQFVERCARDPESVPARILAIVVR